MVGIISSTAYPSPGALHGSLVQAKISPVVLGRIAGSAWEADRLDQGSEADLRPVHAQARGRSFSVLNAKRGLSDFESLIEHILHTFK